MKHQILLKNIFILLLSSLLIISCSTTYVEMKDRTNKTFKVKSKIAKLVDSIAVDRMLSNTPSMPLGASEPSDQYYTYIKLIDKASEEELVFLTDHTSPLVRCCAFEALLEKKSPIIDSIYFAHINDNAIFTVNEGCVIFDLSVFEQYTRLLRFSNYRIKNFDFKILNHFYADSLILYTNIIDKDVRERLIYRIKPKQVFYNKIKSMALNNYSKNAMIVLARYKDSSDFDFINNSLLNTDLKYYALEAVQVNPQTLYLNNIELLFEKYFADQGYSFRDSFWYYLFDALLCYNDSNLTQTVINKVHNKIIENTKSNDFAIKYENNYLRKYLMKALMKHPNSKFEYIKTQISLDSETLDEIQKELELEKQ